MAIFSMTVGNTEKTYLTTVMLFAIKYTYNNGGYLSIQLGILKDSNLQLSILSSDS